MQGLGHQAVGDDGCIQRGVPGEPVVLVIESSVEARCQLAWMLGRAFPNGWVFAAACLGESLHILTAQPVDIAVVDLDLPDGSGMEFIAECFRLSPLTRCVVTTTRDEEDALIQVLAAGALGYLLKDQPEAVLIQQLRLLAHGIPPLAPSVARRLLRYFTEQAAAWTPSVSPSNQLDDLGPLSPREKQVLSLIAKGMQISEVAQLLEITSNTVCSHIKSIYRKRHLSSRAEAALEARRLGLV